MTWQSKSCACRTLPHIEKSIHYQCAWQLLPNMSVLSDLHGAGWGGFRKVQPAQTCGRLGQNTCPPCSTGRGNVEVIRALHEPRTKNTRNIHPEANLGTHASILRLTAFIRRFLCRRNHFLPSGKYITSHNLAQTIRHGRAQLPFTRTRLS